jgi:DNA-binding response OmpR family regulator
VRRAIRVAVVEDRVDIAAPLRVGLEDHGFEVVTLAGATATLERLAAAAPDLICLGVEPAGGPAGQLYAGLAAHPGLAQRPVVIMGGPRGGPDPLDVLGGVAEMPVPAGILATPVDLEEVVRTVNALLGRPLGVAP